MSKEISAFGNVEIEEKNFSHHITPIFLLKVDIEKVLVFNKIFLAKKNYKYFISYLCDVNKFKPLNIMLQKTSSSLKRYHGQTK